MRTDLDLAMAAAAELRGTLPDGGGGGLTCGGVGPTRLRCGLRPAAGGAPAEGTRRRSGHTSTASTGGKRPPSINTPVLTVHFYTNGVGTLGPGIPVWSPPRDRFACVRYHVVAI